jgi:hypothetical protein
MFVPQGAVLSQAPGAFEPGETPREPANVRTAEDHSVREPDVLGIDLQAAIAASVSYSVVFRLKKWDAAGAATARITTDQISAASIGCCIGHAWIVLDGFGFPQRVRVPATTALTGFQVVIVWSQSGMPWVGTIALDMNVSGKRMIKPSDDAVSGFFAFRPMQAETHDTA